MTTKVNAALNALNDLVSTAFEGRQGMSPEDYDRYEALLQAYAEAVRVQACDEYREGADAHARWQDYHND